MSVIIFTGPTLSATKAQIKLEADYRGPAAEGDVYRAARRHPDVIGIIDGYFERVPSVRHKEILWAMSQGIHVFGAASMGALRAAELAAFGMEGVGTIFEAFRDGRLEDDDEVAVAHGAAAFEFRAGSAAMVDIRHTLTRAKESGVVSADTRAALEAAAKSLFYPDRNYSTVIGRGSELGVPASELKALREWLPSGDSSLKRADALAMLRVIKGRVSAGLEPKRVRYWFENSSMWESAWRLAGDSDDSDPILLGAVLEELRLEGAAFLRAQEAAMLRVLAIKQSYVQGMAEAGGQSARAAGQLWSRQNVTDETGKEAWMRENHLNEAQLAALLADEGRLAWIKSLAAFDANGYFLDHLRVSGDYPRLVERARKKLALLSEQAMEDPTLADAGLEARELIRWHFEDRLERPVPADLAAYCDALGFGSRAAFQRALLREFCFLQRLPARSGNHS